ncbi:hypothetical protein CC2G_003509 [Coprinopsis cinerea AmutBmut pab1-1]|nr:hypothetical protein CC2G_003509 [Coprinopsis cinerea AmutBmut pab1-1]
MEVNPSTTGPKLSLFPEVDPLWSNRNRQFQTRFAFITPQDMFEVGRSPYSTSYGFRFIHKDDDLRALVFTDGACSRNGMTDTSPMGGSAAVLGPEIQAGSAIIMEPLPEDGRTHTNNRAELCGALLALEKVHWPSEGINYVVVASDSE